MFLETLMFYFSKASFFVNNMIYIKIGENMHQNQRTKMCPNCEGNVAMEVSICPYCGSSIFTKNENNPKTNDNVKSLSYEETLASLYPPPYKPKVVETSDSLEKEEESKVVEGKEVEEFGKNSLLPTILFWIGVNLVVFSLILLFFSKNGFLLLKWNSNYWYLYSLISLPLLYFGFKGLNNLK